VEEFLLIFLYSPYSCSVSFPFLLLLIAQSTPPNSTIRLRQHVLIIFRIVNVFRPIINLRFFQHVTCTFLVHAYPSDSFINLAVSIKRYCRGHLLAETEPTPSSACKSPHYCRCARHFFHSHRFHRTQHIRPQTRAPTPHFLCTTTHTPTLRSQYRAYLQLNSQFLHQIHVNDQV
jgi:hypothetical protein